MVKYGKNTVYKIVQGSHEHGNLGEPGILGEFCKYSCIFVGYSIHRPTLHIIKIIMYIATNILRQSMHSQGYSVHFMKIYLANPENWKIIMKAAVVGR